MKTGREDKRLPASQRREIIMDAAVRTFVEFGYHGAHMELIAERSDVTKPILYRHFPSKLDLLLAIIDRAGKELLDAYSHAGDAGLDWAERIKLDVRSFLDFIENYGAGYILVYFQGLSIDRQVMERLFQIRRDYRALLAERIRLYADTDAVLPEDIDLMVAMIVGMAESAAILWMGSDDITREACERNLLGAVMKLLGGLPPRRDR